MRTRMVVAAKVDGRLLSVARVKAKRQCGRTSLDAKPRLVTLYCRPSYCRTRVHFAEQ